MNYKLNSKGQGALEYLLIIGGVVLVAVVVVALLIGMSSENTENSKQQSKEFIASTDLALPSTLLSVICKEKTGVDDEYVVKWNPTHKEGYEYTVLFDDKPIIFNNTNPNFDLTPADNPIVFTTADYNTSAGTNPIVAECSGLGSEAISIKTTNTENDTTAVSNRVFIKPQAAGTPSGGGTVEDSLSFNRNTDTLIITLASDLTKPLAGDTVLRFIDPDGNPITESDGSLTKIELELPNDSPYTIGITAINLDPNPICDSVNSSKLSLFRIVNKEDDSTLKEIPLSKMTFTGC